MNKNKEIFKKLYKIGYTPHLYNTLEKINSLDIKSKDFSIEFNLIADWFNQKYNIYSSISLFEVLDRKKLKKFKYKYKVWAFLFLLFGQFFPQDNTRTVEKRNSICRITTYHSDLYNARLNCIIKLLEMVGEFKKDIQIQN